MFCVKYSGTYLGPCPHTFMMEFYQNVAKNGNIWPFPENPEILCLLIFSFWTLQNQLILPYMIYELSFCVIMEKMP